MVTKAIKKILIPSFIVLFLIGSLGCASTKCTPEIQYVDKIVEVKVPVVMKPTIQKVKKPSLPINKLKKDATPKEIVEAYYNSLKLQISYSNSLEKIISKFYEEK